MYDREASFAKSYIVNPSKSTSGQTQRYTPPNVHESVGMNVVAHGQGNARPPQNAHTGDVSVTDTMEIPTIKNTNTKWMTMQRLQGETTVAKRSDSQNIYNHISAVKSTGSHGFSNSVGSGMESPQKKYEADAQHESVTTMKTCVFYIDIKWKPVQPDQMLHFEFGISGDIYRQLFLFITNLLPPTGVRDIPSKSGFQACERYDSLMVMKDKLDISNDTMSDTNVLCMLEKLRTLKCAICKNGGRRKVLRKSYPERKCAIYSTSTKHELHCYFGSNIVDQKSRLLLYHKVICDREPVFICGKEDRNCKAVMERLYDLYLEIAEWRIQVVLRRLTNLRESTFQVSFGINARDMIDFIMFIFTN
ncbi:hypothetical protein, conserved [Babesia bigemina]|uniref:Uncharacterized protein n=1 Tax=Babesia bigemina TaxID=5866 RepID=A0A061D3T2_BABBI|nr:hypothetical protein, conserved [Babesia bigemina]CDR95366.1 hypothetical protein, conserved [Babesia bigemina]|eukprot:XP_012767552.1 hypothetical protein, conserved [Babesia bigemina]